MKTFKRTETVGKLTRSMGSWITVLALWMGVATALVRANDDPVVVLHTAGEFEDIIESVKDAITARGLLVSGTLHVSDMLKRTGKDLGHEKQIYVKAESVEFCSALMSHLMIGKDPRNLVICPFTVAVYVLAEAPDRVSVAYRKAVIAGGDPEVTEKINAMLEGIATEATEF